LKESNKFMRTGGNFLWFIFGAGFLSALMWFLASILAFLSIVGIPWGKACWNLAKLSAFPFGKEAINRKALTQQSDIGTSILGSLGNVIWCIFAGFWIASAHALLGVLYFLTIFGIPFGFQHFKLAGLALFPIGKTVVSKELAKLALEENAKANLAKLRASAAV
jgi:uncharacterized membrane protein YccF (DUF307 family)